MQTKFLMQLNLIIYLFYYFFIVSSCLNKFLIRNDQQQKKYIYITKTSQKQFGRKFNYIGLFNIFSIIFKC